MRPLVQEPRKTRSTVMSLIGVFRRETHIGERPLDRAALVGVVDLRRVGHLAVDAW